jgi:hypothetical protein
VTGDADEPPWMEPLDVKTREAVRHNVAKAPPLTQRQREKLRLLFRAKSATAKAS